MNASSASRTDIEPLQSSGDLSNGVIVVFSGGPIDLMNPREVLSRMEDLITQVNADPFVVAGTGGLGLKFNLIAHQQSKHIHQSHWPEVCEELRILDASPLILVGHSNGGAAVIDVARCLQNQGKNVDLAFTADSVLTLNDDGNVNEVPSNVKLNVNSYVIPTLAWPLLPFPFGQRNERGSGTLEGIVNIGLPFEEPGAIAHRDAFYDLAGGDERTIGGYEFPEIIRQVVLAVLRNDANGQIFQGAKASLQVFANEKRSSIDFETSDEKTTLYPGGRDLGLTTERNSRLPDESIGHLRDTMRQLEIQRLEAVTDGTRQ
jgi:hypothetical protein